MIVGGLIVDFAFRQFFERRFVLLSENQYKE